MDEKTLAEQLKKDPAMLRSLMQSQDGQALMRMLTRGDQGAGLQRAAEAAAKGKPQDMVRMIQQVMRSPGGAELVERIDRAVRK